MKRAKLLKTITVGGSDPSWTICPGHVSADTFNTASSREGWNGPEGLEVTDKEIEHVYIISGRKKNKKHYKIVDKEVKGAKPYTLSRW